MVLKINTNNLGKCFGPACRRVTAVAQFQFFRRKVTDPRLIGANNAFLKEDGYFLTSQPPDFVGLCL